MDIKERTGNCASRAVRPCTSPKPLFIARSPPPPPPSLRRKLASAELQHLQEKNLLTPYLAVCHSLRFSSSFHSWFSFSAFGIPTVSAAASDYLVVDVVAVGSIVLVFTGGHVLWRASFSVGGCLILRSCPRVHMTSFRQFCTTWRPRLPFASSVT